VIGPGVPGIAPESRNLATQIRTIGSIDADLNRTRLYFNLEMNHYATDVLTLQGFAPIMPGTRVRVVIEYINEEGGA